MRKGRIYDRTKGWTDDKTKMIDDKTKRIYDITK